MPCTAAISPLTGRRLSTPCRCNVQRPIAQFQIASANRSMRPTARKPHKRSADRSHLDLDGRIPEISRPIQYFELAVTSLSCRKSLASICAVIGDIFGEIKPAGKSA